MPSNLPPDNVLDALVELEDKYFNALLLLKQLQIYIHETKQAMNPHLITSSFNKLNKEYNQFITKYPKELI